MITVADIGVAPRGYVIRKLRTDGNWDVYYPGDTLPASGNTYVAASQEIGTGGVLYDETDAINAALVAQYEVFTRGIHRVDGTIVIPPGKRLIVAKGHEIKRTAASASTAAVVHVKGIGSELVGGGRVTTQNHHPQGVVACGHIGFGDTYNAQKWLVENIDIYGRSSGSTGGVNTTVGTVPGVSANIGIFVPNSQPFVGSSAANYFGSIRGSKINQSDIGLLFTDMSNAHQVHDLFLQDIYGSYIQSHGAYANLVIGAWFHRGKVDGITGIYLRDKLFASAPYASGHNSYRNSFLGIRVEPVKVCDAVKIEAGSYNNFIELSSNTGSSAVVDANGANWYVESGGAAKFKGFSGSVVPTSDANLDCGDRVARWVNTWSQQFRPGDGSVVWTSGLGSPEGVVTAGKGSMFLRIDGPAETTMYVKEAGSGNTGWTAK